MVFPEKDERVSGISQTKTGTVSEVTLGKLLRDVVERVDTTVNGSELQRGLDDRARMVRLRT